MHNSQHGLNSKEIHDTLTAENVAMPSIQQCYYNPFRDTGRDWENIYIFPCIVLLESKMRDETRIHLSCKCHITN